MDRELARKKAIELVSQMTVEEKASQLKYDAPAIPRLNVPAYNWWGEGIHGVARAGIATVFAQSIGQAAAFDDELVKEVAQCVAEEGRAKYNEYSKHGDRDIYKGLTYWSPNVNIFRDPRWGRGHETYGEDPYLTSRLGVAFVEGLQGDGDYMKVAGCAKHFAVHSGPEAIRHEFDAEANAKDMEETYFPAFEALVKEAGVEAVMGAYNRTNGEPCCGSKALMKDLLRGKWGFEGHYVSDCWAIKDFHENHLVTKTPAESAALAINMGCDLNCGNTYLHMLNAYEQGLVSEETITESAVRLFTTRYLLGLFDETEYDSIPYEVVECEEHIALADKVTLKSPVLLKNDGILPINRDKVKTIGVVGPNANSRAVLVGNYHGTSSEYVTVLEGIQEMAGKDIRVLYSEGCHLFEDKTEPLAVVGDRLAEAKIVAEHSDIVVLVVGLDETLEGEEGDTGNSYASGDKESLLLPMSQQRLLEAIAETGKPVILLMMTGSAMDLRFANEHYNAILQTWYPGARGGRSIAKLLFGEVSPSGKLPVTFYDDLSKMPEFTDYAMKGRTYRYMDYEAQYPFGFGLTYGDVRVNKAELLSADGQTAAKLDIASAVNTDVVCTVKAFLENKGTVDTDEVVQVYVKNEDSAFAVPNPALSGFKRVHVKTGEEVSVEIPVRRLAFTVVNEEGERILDGSRYSVYVGTSQPDSKSIALTGKKPIKLDVES